MNWIPRWQCGWEILLYEVYPKYNCQQFILCNNYFYQHKMINTILTAATKIIQLLLFPVYLDYLRSFLVTNRYLPRYIPTLWLIAPSITIFYSIMTHKIQGTKLLRVVFVTSPFLTFLLWRFKASLATARCESWKSYYFYFYFVTPCFLLNID